MPQSPDELLQSYIDRLGQLRETADDDLTAAELREIAMEVGLSEEDLARADEVADAHLERAEQYLARRLFKDGLRELQAARGLRPRDPAILGRVARAHWDLFQAERRPTDLVEAEQYARRAIALDPEIDLVYDILEHVHAQNSAQRVTNRRLLIAFGLGALLFAGGLVAHLRASDPVEPISITTVTPLNEPPVDVSQAVGYDQLPGYLDTSTLPAGLTVRVSAVDGMPQVLVPGGVFRQGGDPAASETYADEQPRREVYVSPFWADMHEVTNAQYRQFLEATGMQPTAEWLEWEQSTSPRHPAVQISWLEAFEYARWAGRQLPTEAQWERAARAGTETLYPWGDDPSLRLAAGNWQSAESVNVAEAIRPVASYRPNAFGLFDVVGNVWEPCQDRYDEEAYAKLPDHNPVNTTSGEKRVYRGGSAGSKPNILRVAYRGSDTIEARDTFSGIRCVEPATATATSAPTGTGLDRPLVGD